MDARLWQAPQLRHHLDRLKNSIDLLRAVSLELEVIGARRCEEELAPGQEVTGGGGDGISRHGDPRKQHIDGILGRESRGLDGVEEAALDAAGHLYREVEAMVLLLEGILEGTAPWEELTAVAKFRERRTKLKSNRKRRKAKRQQDAINRRMADEVFEEADRRAEEWRTREIAKDIVKRKMEKMNELAMKKAKEERLRLETEMEKMLIAEKLQELRSLRIQKLKKQGHWFPQEDDNFMERVRLAVEADERQAAEVSKSESNERQPEASTEPPTTNSSPRDHDKKQALPQPQPQQCTTKTNETPAQRLPPDLYQYYYGSSIDMGTLIEVRRGWDMYIMPGGSRIPGHWVQPVAPTSDGWAACLRHREDTR